MLYAPDTPWLIVLPINHILGRVPLLKAYLCGSSSPTIPRALFHFKQTNFRYGEADRNGMEGSGSPLFMLLSASLQKTASIPLGRGRVWGVGS